MHRTATGLALAAAVAALAACDTTTSPPPTPSALLGDFQAQTLTFTRADDPNVRSDLVQDQFGFDLTMRDDGTFVSRLTDPQGAVTERAGSFAVNGTEVMFGTSPIVFADPTFVDGTFAPTTFQWSQDTGGTSLTAEGANFRFGGPEAPPAAATMEVTMQPI